MNLNPATLISYSSFVFKSTAVEILFAKRYGKDCFVVPPRNDDH
jgi:hypothetical protein